jgi:hypothetical protein
MAAGAFLCLMYSVVVIIFRYAFHVELWNPLTRPRADGKLSTAILSLNQRRAREEDISFTLATRATTARGTSKAAEAVIKGAGSGPFQQARRSIRRVFLLPRSG